MPVPDLRAAHPWLAGLIAEHRAEVERRGLVIRIDTPPGLLLAHDERLDRAFRELIHFVVGTVPDDCEIYLAASRGGAPVTRVGAGQIILRWQVAGRSAPDTVTPDVSVVRMRPAAADAETLLKTAPAGRVRAAFEAADGLLRLEAASKGRELTAWGSWS